MGEKASTDLFDTISDIRQTGTQELKKNMDSVLSSTPTNVPAEKKVSNTPGKAPSVSDDQISVAQEKREKEIIERRRVLQKD